jgi:hypothetical protein
MNDRYIGWQILLDKRCIAKISQSMAQAFFRHGPFTDCI